jgi:hypothetical protein
MFAHRANLGILFSRTSWFEVTAMEFERVAPKPPTVEGYSPEEAFVQIEGRFPSGVTVDRHQARVQQRAVDEWRNKPEGAALWAPSDTEAWIAVETRSDGSVAFVGDCADKTHTGVYEQFITAQRAKGERRSAAQVLAAILADREGPEATALRAGPPRPSPGAVWLGQKPELRQYGPDTPPDVLARTPVRNLTFTTPREWGAFDGTLCFRSPSAWGGCAAFAAIGVGEPAEVTTHFDGQNPVEVWLLEGGDLSRPVVRLATISAEQMSAETLNLVADPSITTYEELVREARVRAVLTPAAE